MNIYKLIVLFIETLENQVNAKNSVQFNNDLSEAINALKKIKNYF
jgi:hypothetical protein